MLKRETRALFVLQSLERQRYSIFGVTQTDVSASNYIVPFDDLKVKVNINKHLACLTNIVIVQ